MDYNLAALKLFCGQLKDAQPTSSSPSSLSLGSILFQRAWLQVSLFNPSFLFRFRRQMYQPSQQLVDLTVCMHLINGESSEQGTSHASAPGGARLHCHSYLRRLLDISTNISHATEIRSVQDVGFGITFLDRFKLFYRMIPFLRLRISWMGHRIK
ncbi:hypothetical protein ACLOJK_031733 [Asimina triloba]